MTDVGHIKKGDVVCVPFPFDDKQEGSSKLKEKDRPAVVLFQSDKDSFVLCPITKQPHREDKIPLNGKDLDTGRIDYDPSFIRPNIITTVMKNLIRKKIGTLKPEKLEEVVNKVKEFLDKQPEEAPVPKPFERVKRIR